MNIYEIICDQLGLTRTVDGRITRPKLSLRAEHILAHYQSRYDRNPTFYAQLNLTECCLRDLAGANGAPDRKQRTEPKL